MFDSGLNRHDDTAARDHSGSVPKPCGPGMVLVVMLLASLLLLYPAFAGASVLLLGP
jgi:hypothetical protein